MTSMQHEYCNRTDIPKIITMLEDIVLKNGWDANIGVGPGDYAFGDIRIPSKVVPDFISILKDVHKNHVKDIELIISLCKILQHHYPKDISIKMTQEQYERKLKLLDTR